MPGLIKGQTIHRLLKELEARFGKGAFDITDNWDADLFAVGIARPDDPARLVYISTYKLYERDYFVELEMPPEPESDLLYEPAGNYEGISLEQVMTLVGERLNLLEIEKEKADDQ